MIYNRLLSLKQAAQSLASSERPYQRLNPLAVELGLAHPIPVVDGGPEAPAHFYDHLLDLCERWFDKEIDNATFEEHTRYMFGVKAYPMFCIDKIIPMMIKNVRRASISVCSRVPSVPLTGSPRWFLLNPRSTFSGPKIVIPRSWQSSKGMPVARIDRSRPRSSTDMKPKKGYRTMSMCAASNGYVRSLSLRRKSGCSPVSTRVVPVETLSCGQPVTAGRSFAPSRSSDRSPEICVLPAVFCPLHFYRDGRSIRTSISEKVLLTYMLCNRCISNLTSSFDDQRCLLSPEHGSRDSPERDGRATARTFGNIRVKLEFPSYRLRIASGSEDMVWRKTSSNVGEGQRKAKRRKVFEKWIEQRLAEIQRED